eukprot:1267652-Amphidinium_carterae.2
MSTNLLGVLLDSRILQRYVKEKIPQLQRVKPKRCAAGYAGVIAYPYVYQQSENITLISTL